MASDNDDGFNIKAERFLKLGEDLVGAHSDGEEALNETRGSSLGEPSSSYAPNWRSFANQKINSYKPQDDDFIDMKQDIDGSYRQSSNQKRFSQKNAEDFDTNFAASSAEQIGQGDGNIFGTAASASSTIGGNQSSKGPLGQMQLSLTKIADILGEINNKIDGLLGGIVSGTNAKGKFGFDAKSDSSNSSGDPSTGGFDWAKIATLIVGGIELSHVAGPGVGGAFADIIGAAGSTFDKWGKNVGKFGESIEKDAADLLGGSKGFLSKIFGGAKSAATKTANSALVQPTSVALRAKGLASGLASHVLRASTFTNSLIDLKQMHDAGIGTSEYNKKAQDLVADTTSAAGNYTSPMTDAFLSESGEFFRDMAQHKSAGDTTKGMAWAAVAPSTKYLLSKFASKIVSAGARRAAGGAMGGFAKRLAASAGIEATAGAMGSGGGWGLASLVGPEDVALALPAAVGAGAMYAGSQINNTPLENRGYIQRHLLSTGGVGGYELINPKTHEYFNPETKQNKIFPYGIDPDELKRRETFIKTMDKDHIQIPQSVRDFVKQAELELKKSSTMDTVQKMSPARQNVNTQGQGHTSTTTNNITINVPPGTNKEQAQLIAQKLKEALDEINRKIQDKEAYSNQANAGNPITNSLTPWGLDSGGTWYGH